MSYTSLRLYLEGLEHDKEASVASNRRRRAYYQKNRARILSANRAYRARNRAVLSRKARIYRRKLNSGMIRARTRQRVGQGYIYTGVKVASFVKEATAITKEQARLNKEFSKKKPEPFQLPTPSIATKAKVKGLKENRRATPRPKMQGTRSNPLNIGGRFKPLN